MLTFRFNGADGKMFGSDVLTTGMVGQEIRLEFSREWEGLTKTAVFTAGEVTRDVLVESDRVKIPVEVLSVPLVQLMVGVCGVSDDGRVIPTIQAAGPYICEGTDPSGDESVEPTLPVWAQLQTRLEDLEKGTLDVDLTWLNLHYDKSGTWIYPVSNDMDVAAILAAVQAGRRLRLRFLRRNSPLTVMLDSCCVKQGAAECSGVFAEVLSGAEAVRGIITLEIFSVNNAVLVACMNPPSGITPEQFQELRANTEALADLPISRTEDGYTQITGQRHPVSLRVERTGNTVTVITTLQGDVVHHDVLTLDERGIPASMNMGGVVCPVEFVGFEEESNGV